MENKAGICIRSLKEMEKIPLPREQNSCPRHQLPEELRAGVCFPLHLPRPRTWVLEQRDQRIKSEGWGDLFAKRELGQTCTLVNL